MTIPWPSDMEGEGKGNQGVILLNKRLNLPLLVCRAVHHLSDGYGRPRASQVMGMDLPSTVHPNMSVKCQRGWMVTVMAVL